MNESMRAFLAEASENDDLKRRLAEAFDGGTENPGEKVAAIAREAGFDLNAEDMEKLHCEGAENAEELDEKELAQVAGGGASGGGERGHKSKSACSCSFGGEGQAPHHDVTEGCFCQMSGSGKCVIERSFGTDTLNCTCFFYGDGTSVRDLKKE